MNLQEARVIDPLLTTHAQGYKHAARVGHMLFPAVEVTKAGGKSVKFGKESFMLYNARRAPGADVKEIEFGYTGEPYLLVQDSLDAKVPREHLREGDTLPGPDLGMRATNTVMNSLTLTLEVDQAALATDTAKYGANNKSVLSGTSQWSDKTNAVPIDSIENAKEAVRQACGLKPNTMIIGAQVWKHLKHHPTILSRFQFSSDKSITTDMIANLLELERVGVGEAVYSDQDGNFNDVWGNLAVLAYVPKKPEGYEEPSYGYTYTMKGHPLIEEPYYSGKKRSFYYGSTYERQPIVTAFDAGYLFTNVVA